MKLLKMGIVGVALAQLIYLITRDPKLGKEIHKAKEWKKIQDFQRTVKDRNQEMIHKVKEIDYKQEREDVKVAIKDKEKDLQTHIKKLQNYTDSLGDKKVNEIIHDIQGAFDEAVEHVSASIGSAKKTVKKVSTGVKKKVATKKAKSVAKKKVATVKKAKTSIKKVTKTGSKK